MTINSPQLDVEKMDSADCGGFVEKILHGLGDVVEIVKERRGAVLIILMCAIGSVGLPGCEKKASGGGREGRPIISEELKKSLEAEAAAEKAAVERAAAEKAKKYIKYSIKENEHGGYYYYIDVDGSNLFGDRYFRRAEPFMEGLAVVCNSNECRYIDKNGDRIFGDTVFEDATSFHEGLAVVTDNMKRGNYYYIDKNGGNAFGHEEFKSAEPFQDGIALVVVDAHLDNERYQFINRQGQNAFGIKKFYWASSFAEGFAAVTLRVRDVVSREMHFEWFYINRNGENAFGSKVFRAAAAFSEGVAAVKELEYGSWYYINDKGERMFNNKVFIAAGPFQNGFAEVTEGRRPYTMNKFGQEVKKKRATEPPKDKPPQGEKPSSEGTQGVEDIEFYE